MRYRNFKVPGVSSFEIGIEPPLYRVLGVTDFSPRNRRLTWIRSFSKQINESHLFSFRGSAFGANLRKLVSVVNSLAMGNIDTFRNTTTVVTLAANGEVVIPETLRGELGFLAGDRLVARVVDGALVIESVDSRIRRAQEIVRRYIPEGVSLADELIAERHAEAERE